MSTLVTTAAMPEGDDLNKMTNEELAAAIQQGCFNLLKGIAWTAVLAVEARRRGMEVVYPVPGLEGMLLKIGNGKMLPELLVHFAGSQNLLKKLSDMSIDDQRRLASGGHVKLAVARPDGSNNGGFIMADPLLMTQEQIRQVFADGRIRSHEEQVLLLEQAAASRLTAVPAPTADGVGLFVPMTATSLHRLGRKAKQSGMTEAEYARKILEANS